MIQSHHFKTDMKSKNACNVFNASILEKIAPVYQYLYVQEKTNV